MFAFIFTELFVLLIIIFLLLILSWVWPPDSPWAPWWQMPSDVIKKMCTMAKISSKDVVYDLGCGTGNALIYASRTYNAKGVGIEIDPIRYRLARLNVWKVRHSGAKRSGVIESQRSYRAKALQDDRTQITLLRKNFFDVSLAPATVIFIYLVPAALKRLTPKFLRELKPRTKFISYVYPMPEELFKGKLKLMHHDTKNKIFLYQLLTKS
ncbi:MAG TPA: N-6 DNA methylase [Candidatus Eisenbacteria bacterium]|nr:N-6 DNA methylase [Candidatus Eisenbacteria bacterium]